MNEEFDNMETEELGEGMAHALAMFRLMYPLVEVPTGRPCQDPDCDCDGENMEMATICSAVN